MAEGGSSVGATCEIPRAKEGVLDALAPLLRHLEANAPVTAPTMFPVGALLPNGRLDLCKQGLGPKGARLVADALRSNTFVSSALLGSDAIGNDGAAAVAELLRENRRLTTAFLGCNQVDATGVKALAGSLSDHPTLRGLWLKRNPLGSDGVNALAEALRSNTSLRTLDLAQTQVDTAAGEALTDALTSGNRSIERLYVSGNQLGVADAAWLAAVAAGSLSLRALFIDGNRLGDDAVISVASALRANPRLEEVSFGTNGLSTAGLQAVLQQLRGHPSLRALDAGRAPFAGPAGAGLDELTDDCAFFFGILIRESPTLCSLTLDARGISEAGVDVILDAVDASRTVTHLNLQRRLTSSQRARLDAALARNRAIVEPLAVAADVLAARSASRSGKIQSTPPAAPTVTIHRPPDGPPVAISPEDLATCARVLETLARQPGEFFERDMKLNPVRAGANRLVEAVRGESDRRRQQRSTAESASARARRKAHDAAVVASTGLRQMRLDQPLLPPPPKPAAVLLAKPRSCYVCKAAFHEVHAWYDSLCPSCAALNAAKREQTADLTGKTVLITGGRIKIGYEATLKLLRTGARVIMTTRFPVDAAARFAREPDFDAWKQRLQIHGLDLRDLSAVERFAQAMAGELDRLDVLVNNAAQTVHRPPEFYRHLQDMEARGPAVLPQQAAALVSVAKYHGNTQAVPSAALSRIPLLPGDFATDTGAFPLALFDRHGQQKDLRGSNSWTLQVGQIDTNEVLETHYVNAIAPFVLINHLLPLMERTPGRKFVVNVSAMEGKFDYARKQSTHPHTNMAKASLNMLTRTVAASLAERGVFMNSVDTGWVTNENPHPLTEAMRANLNFEPPLDEIDGASRVLDPVFSAGDSPTSGLFLKDYKPVGW